MSGCIFKRGDTGKYYIKFQTMDGRWIKEKVGESRKDAEKALVIRQAEVFQGKFNLADHKQKTIVFEKWVTEFYTVLSDKKAKNRLNPVVKFFKGKNINKITLWDVERYKRDRSQQVAEFQVNQELQMLKRCCKFAHEKGYQNSLANAKMPTFKNASWGRKKIMNSDEEQALLEAAIKLQFIDVYNFLVIGLNTGLRTGEVFVLKFPDIDFKANRINFFQNKVKSWKHIPINNTLRNLLEKLFAEKNGEYVLTNSDEPMNAHTFKHHWRKAHKAAGVDKEIVPYTVRHTFCTRLAENGVPLPRLMKYSGHKTLAMVMRYAHPEENDEDLKLLDKKVIQPIEQISNA